RVDPAIVGDVVAVVAERRLIKGKEPECRDAQLLEVVQSLREANEVPDTISVGIVERPDMELVDDGVLVPERVVRQGLGVYGPGAGSCHSSASHKKYSKSRSVVRRVRRTKMWAGVTCGSSST